jgi:hypothetical protein
MFLELWISTKDVYRLLTLGLLSVNVRVMLSVELSRERLASASSISFFDSISRGEYRQHIVDHGLLFQVLNHVSMDSSNTVLLRNIIYVRATG